MSVSLLSILGDALWIVAMSMIASGAQRFWRRLPETARVPMPWGFSRIRGGRVSAVGVAVGLPLAAGLVLSAIARDPDLAPDRVLLAFLARAFTAPLFVLAHHAWMRAATRTLDAEGALKP